MSHVVHVVDGTYELFRHHFGAPSVTDTDGRERGAVVGVLASLLGMLEAGATHVGVATDHVVESFRNELWADYKTGEGIEPVLLDQFHPLEQALTSMGVAVWPMKEFEADDALASAAARAAAFDEVERVLICTPDKDLSQCVVGERVVQFDRRAREIRNADGVRAKFGVDPPVIPDYLALVGDSSDGFPGLKGWGAKSAGAVLGHYGKLESVPLSGGWDVTVRSQARLQATLREGWEDAMLFRTLATLRVDAPTFTDLADLRWAGPGASFPDLCESLSTPALATRAARLAESRS